MVMTIRPSSTVYKRQKEYSREVQIRWVKPEDFGRSTTRGIDREMYRDRSYSSGSRSAIVKVVLPPTMISTGNG